MDSESQDLASLKLRFEGLESRLAGIEKRLGLAPQKPAVPIPPQTPPAVDPVKVITYPPVHNEMPSGNWLGVVAVICFVLAAGFILKLTIDSGWLTPIRQLGLAVTFGLSLIGIGFWLSKSEREYASLLPAAGIIVLYLTAFASHRIHALLSFNGALIAIGFTSALCIWLYTLMKHDIYALTAAVGAYLAPLILNLDSSNVFSAHYFLLCSFAFATIAVWVESRTLAIVSAYLAIGTTALLGTTLGMDQLIATLLGLHFLIFTISTALHSRVTGLVLGEGAAFAYSPVLLLFYTSEYFFLNRINAQLAPYWMLALGLVPLALLMLAKRWWPAKPLPSRSMIYTFTTIVLFHTLYLEIMPEAAHGWLFSVLILAAATMPSSIFEGAKSPAAKAPRIALFVVLAIEYVGMVFKLFDKPPVSSFDASVASALLALFSLWFAIVMIVKKGRTHLGDASGYLFAAHILAILGLYNLAYHEGSLAVSIAWLLYAAGVMLFAFTIKNAQMAKSAVAILGLAAAKALLYDAASAATIVRIVCLMLTGICLYGAGLLMRKIATWDTNKPV